MYACQELLVFFSISFSMLCSALYMHVIVHAMVQWCALRGRHRSSLGVSTVLCIIDNCL